MDNLILYDALSMTSSTIDDPHFWIEFMGLGALNWVEGRSRYYDHRRYSSTISVHYNDEPGGGTWLEMMGQGCRTFEDIGTADFESLFALVTDRPDEFKITRLDVALDDHTGLVDLAQLSEDARKHEYISKFREWDVREGSKGRSVNHGSMGSDIYLRIYDKAMERKIKDKHWIRFELQLRDELAVQFACLKLPIGERFCGVLNNYLRYVDPQDGFRYRWPTKQYWADLIGAAEKIKLYVKPGLEYNLSKLDDLVFRQTGNATAAAMKIYGYSQFMNRLNTRNTLSNPKYDKLIAEYQRKGKPDENKCKDGAADGS